MRRLVYEAPEILSIEDSHEWVGDYGKNYFFDNLKQEIQHFYLWFGDIKSGF